MWRIIAGKPMVFRYEKEFDMGFMDKAKDFANDHDKQVDQGLEKVGDQIDDRTGNKHSAQIDKGIDQAQQRTGTGDTTQQ